MSEREVRKASEPNRLPDSTFGWLLARWPSLVALGLVLLMWPTGAENTVRVLAEFLVVLALIYLVTAALGKPTYTWAILGALTVVFVLLETQDRVPTTAALSVIAAAAVLWAALTRRVDRAFVLQLVGFVLFTATAVFAQHADLGAARIAVAAGWIAHGLWDYGHRRADRTVARSFAEFCGLVDVLVGLAVLTVP